MMHQYTLQNNANVYLVPQKDAQSATFLVMYPVGSRFESENLRGVSHYIEHLFFKGTKKRPNTLTLTREIDRLGAQYNAFTGKEYTGYYIKVDVQYTEIALDILSDMLNNSTFDPKEMEREKAVIVEEIKMYNDNPMMNIANIFEEVMFKGSRLGNDIAGTPKHVMSYKRKDVLAYKKKYYQPSNMHIVVAGAQHEKLDTYIKKYFGIGSDKKKPSHAHTPAAFGPSKKSERIIVQKKDVDQAQLMLGFPAFKSSDYKNLAGLSVLDIVVGGSMSSRLFIKIRERLGLAYMVRSGIDEYEDTGYFYIRAGLDPTKINKAIAAIKKELTRIKEKGITARELEDAKTHFRGSMTLSMESSSNLANWYGEKVISKGKILSPQEWMGRIDTVTKEQVQQIANRVLKEQQMRVAIIGNVSEDQVEF